MWNVYIYDIEIDKLMVSIDIHLRQTIDNEHMKKDSSSARERRVGCIKYIVKIYYLDK
jgi:hypothetical protein